MKRLQDGTPLHMYIVLAPDTKETKLKWLHLYKCCKIVYIMTALYRMKNSMLEYYQKVAKYILCNLTLNYSLTKQFINHQVL